jgi:hypothetical protein
MCWLLLSLSVDNNERHSHLRQEHLEIRNIATEWSVIPLVDKSRSQEDSDWNTIGTSGFSFTLVNYILSHVGSSTPSEFRVQSTSRCIYDTVLGNFTAHILSVGILTTACVRHVSFQWEAVLCNKGRSGQVIGVLLRMEMLWNNEHVLVSFLSQRY